MAAVDDSDRTVPDLPKLTVGSVPPDPPTTLVRASSFLELPPGSVVDDTYEIDARIGAGAMGEVYAARHLRLGKRVAIKVIGQGLSEDADAIERFAMEARTLAQIQHPAIVAVDHIGELADGRAYFSMELLRGETLFDRIQRGRLPLPEALRVLDQIARGIDAAHGEGITHRDLKPENVFLVHLPGEPPAVKIVDYGLAKLASRVDHLRGGAPRTESGVAIGTPLYMSPEQMRGQDVDHRTDIYALGCVGYELVLGQSPFSHARTTPELYAAHLHEIPPLPRLIWPEIPPQLDLVLFAMLAKDPAHRPTLEQFRAVVAQVGRDDSSQRALTEFVGSRVPKARLKLSTMIALGLVAVLGGIVIGTLTTTTTRTSEVQKTPPIEPTERAPKVHAAPTPTSPAPPAAPIVTPIITPPIVTPLPLPPPVTPPLPRPKPTVTADAGIDATETADAAEVQPPAPEKIIEPPPPSQPEKPQVAKPKTPPPINRNQTFNPFAKKHKANP